MIIGATGGTGQHQVSHALAAGHTVTALVRDPSRLMIAHERLQVWRGNVLDATTLTGSLDDVAAVMSALGSISGRRPTDVCSAGIEKTLTVMKAPALPGSLVSAPSP